MNNRIEIISATRHSEEAFWKTSALGLSLTRLSKDERLVPTIAFENTRGLPEIYNDRIQASEEPAVLAFIHDDVWIDDNFLPNRLDAGLDAFDVVGVAGTRTRAPRQPGWLFPDLHSIPDKPSNLSGAVAHGRTPFGKVSFFGTTPAPCELLDGLLLASTRETLLSHGLRFDPRFQFHMYDLDFCRTAREQGLSLGTWPISLTHQSSGNFRTPEWLQAYGAYIRKWGE